MKRILILCALCCPVSAMALDIGGGVVVGPPAQAISTPSTSCPSGYIAVVEEHMDIANSSCPSGYTSAGTATSCIASNPGGSCIMYAPVGVSYTDATGTYEFEQPCAME